MTTTTTKIALQRRGLLSFCDHYMAQQSNAVETNHIVGGRCWSLGDHYMTQQSNAVKTFFSILFGSHEEIQGRDMFVGRVES